MVNSEGQPEDWEPPSSVAFTLFSGASMSFTAFPVLASLLMSSGLLHTPLGTQVGRHRSSSRMQGQCSQHKGGRCVQHRSSPHQQQAQQLPSSDWLFVPATTAAMACAVLQHSSSTAAMLGRLVKCSMPTHPAPCTSIRTMQDNQPAHLTCC
jgi:hypothetical protein